MGIDLPQDPARSLLGIHPKNVLSYYTDTCLDMLTAALFIIAGN